MTDRAYISVNPLGKHAPRFDLVVDGIHRGRLSYLDIVEYLSKALDAVKDRQPFEIVPGSELSHVETITFAMQAWSSLRWDRGGAA